MPGTTSPVSSGGDTKIPGATTAEFSPLVQINVKAGQTVFMTSTAALMVSQVDAQSALAYACYYDGKNWSPFDDEAPPAVAQTMAIKPLLANVAIGVTRVGLQTFKSAATVWVAMCGTAPNGSKGTPWISGGSAKTVTMIVE